MPLHRQVTRCLRGGAVSKFCTCQHCTLSVCDVCGAYEGALTTDCPGMKVSFDRQQEVYETCLDYEDDRGWHQGEPMKRRASRFEALSGTAPNPPSGTAIAPSSPVPIALENARGYLEHVLARKAIAWVLADRACDDSVAALKCVEDEVDTYLGLGVRSALEHDTRATELLQRLKGADSHFHLADQRAQKCDEEFRQAARRLVDTLAQASNISADR